MSKTVFGNAQHGRTSVPQKGEPRRVSPPPRSRHPKRRVNRITRPLASMRLQKDLLLLKVVNRTVCLLGHHQDGDDDGEQGEEEEHKSSSGHW